jgi:hypothetical protein
MAAPKRSPKRAVAAPRARDTVQASLARKAGAELAEWDRRAREATTPLAKATTKAVADKRRLVASKEALQHATRITRAAQQEARTATRKTPRKKVSTR